MRSNGRKLCDGPTGAPRVSALPVVREIVNEHNSSLNKGVRNPFRHRFHQHFLHQPNHDSANNHHHLESPISTNNNPNSSGSTHHGRHSSTNIPSAHNLYGREQAPEDAMALLSFSRQVTLGRSSEVPSQYQRNASSDSANSASITSSGTTNSTARMNMNQQQQSQSHSINKSSTDERKEYKRLNSPTHYKTIPQNSTINANTITHSTPHMTHAFKPNVNADFQYPIDFAAGIVLRQKVVLPLIENEGTNESNQPNPSWKQIIGTSANDIASKLGNYMKGDQILISPFLPSTKTKATETSQPKHQKPKTDVKESWSKKRRASQALDHHCNNDNNQKVSSSSSSSSPPSPSSSAQTPPKKQLRLNGLTNTTSSSLTDSNDEYHYDTNNDDGYSLAQQHLLHNIYHFDTHDLPIVFKIETCTAQDSQVLQSWYHELGDKYLTYTSSSWSKWWQQKCRIPDPASEMIKLVFSPQQKSTPTSTTPLPSSLSSTNETQPCPTPEFHHLNANDEIILGFAYYERNIVDHMLNNQRTTLIKGIRIHPLLNPQVKLRCQLNSFQSYISGTTQDTTTSTKNTTPSTYQIQQELSTQLLTAVIFKSLLCGTYNVGINSIKHEPMEQFYHTYMGNAIAFRQDDGRKYFALQRDERFSFLRSQFELQLNLHAMVASPSKSSFMDQEHQREYDKQSNHDNNKSHKNDNSQNGLKTTTKTSRSSSVSSSSSSSNANRNEESKDTMVPSPAALFAAAAAEMTPRQISLTPQIKRYMKTNTEDRNDDIDDVDDDQKEHYSKDNCDTNTDTYISYR